MVVHGGKTRTLNKNREECGTRKFNTPRKPGPPRVALSSNRERDRSFRRLPKQRQGPLVASIGSQFDLEGLHRFGQRLEDHFRAAKILGRVVIEVELARLFVDDEGPFVLGRKRPDAVASCGKF
jgi:hypothetical protein